MRLNKNQLFSPVTLINKAHKAIKNLKFNSSAIANKVSNRLAFLVLFIALIALSCSPIFTKLSETEISAGATIFNRLWIATIVLILWQQINIFSQFEQNPPLNVVNPPQFIGYTESSATPLTVQSPLNYKQQGLLILASITSTTSSLCWAWSLTQTSVASSTVLRGLTPLFITIGGWLILKQTCDRKFLIGMMLSIVGGIVIGWDDLQLGTEYLVGDGIALLSAALHGGNLLIVGYLRDRLDTLTILFWRCTCGVAIMFPLVWLTGETLLPISRQGWLLVISLAVVCQTWGKGLLVYSLKQFSSSFVAIFMLLKPIVTALLAWIIFAESLSFFNGAAVILVLAGIYIAKSSNSAEKTAQT